MQCPYVNRTFTTYFFSWVICIHVIKKLTLFHFTSSVNIIFNKRVAKTLPGFLVLYSKETYSERAVDMDDFTWILFWIQIKIYRYSKETYSQQLGSSHRWIQMDLNLNSNGYLQVFKGTFTYFFYHLFSSKRLINDTVDNWDIFLRWAHM